MGIHGKLQPLLHFQQVYARLYLLAKGTYLLGNHLHCLQSHLNQHRTIVNLNWVKHLLHLQLSTLHLDLTSHRGQNQGNQVCLCLRSHFVQDMHPPELLLDCLRSRLRHYLPTELARLGMNPRWNLPHYPRIRHHHCPATGRSQLGTHLLQQSQSCLRTRLHQYQPIVRNYLGTNRHQRHLDYLLYHLNQHLPIGRAHLEMHHLHLHSHRHLSRYQTTELW